MRSLSLAGVSFCLFGIVILSPFVSAVEAEAQSQTEPVATSIEAPPVTEPATSRLRWSGGTGVEVRGEQEINPQYMEARVFPQFFLQMRYFPYTVSIEGSYERRDSSSGQLSVSSQSSRIGIWGRYEFRNPLQWSPFLGLGIGQSFDRVDMNYGDGLAAKAYAGQRQFAGLSAGLSHALWDHVLQELETKAVLIEDRRDIAWSLIYRLGFVY